MFHSNGLHGTTAGFQPKRGRRDRRAQREVTFAPAEKTTTAKRSGNKGAEVGKDEMHEHIVMRSWKQKPDAITYSYRGMVSGVLHTGTGVNQL